MKTAETKSTHSQQHKATDKSSADQAQERPFFSETTVEQQPFFQPFPLTGIQAKFTTEQAPFFQPVKQKNQNKRKNSTRKRLQFNECLPLKVKFNPKGQSFCNGCLPLKAKMKRHCKLSH